VALDGPGLYVYVFVSVLVTSTTVFVNNNRPELWWTVVLNPVTKLMQNVLLVKQWLTTSFSCSAASTVSQKIPPPLKVFSQPVGIFSPNFTHLIYVPIYAGLQFFIQLPTTLMKLCHIKHDHHNVLKMSTMM